MMASIKQLLRFCLTLGIGLICLHVNAQLISDKRACGTTAPDVAWENWFSGKINKLKQDRLAGKSAATTVTIPVIVHILHSGTAVGVAENISLAQVMSQIDVLNKDYSGTNTDIVNVPTDFQSIKAGNTGIQFCLAKQDPNGIALAEDGVERINWQTRGWSNPNSYTGVNNALGLRTYFNDTVKPATIWDPTKYLNIWLAQIENSGLLGLSTFPIGTGMTDITSVLETPTTSGVIINQKAWGTIGTAASGNYNKGRTATHEIGHWLGLYHTFQGGCMGMSTSTCSSEGDYCCDTPPEGSPAYGCPSGQNTCLESPTDKPDMTMNYMDYVYDACMYMFSLDQATRMQTAMANGTYRAPLKNSPGCITPKPDLIIDSVKLSQTTVSSGNPVNISYVVKNIYNGYSAANYVQFYISSDNILTPNANGDTYLDQDNFTTVLNPLSQSTLITRSLTVPGGLNTGTYYIFVVADGTSLVMENNENNNAASIAINVLYNCSSGFLPNITLTTDTVKMCYSAASQNAIYAYSNAINNPTKYSITWSSTPTNSFVNVTDATLAANQISVLVPAGTAVGIYTGILKLKNANDCTSQDKNIAIVISNTPTITASAAASTICSSSNAQTTTLTYSAVTNAPVTYSIVWNTTPYNNFSNVTNVTLPSSPITLNIPAGAAAGTYTGNLFVTNAIGCTSAARSFTFTILAMPTITIASSANTVCQNATAQTTSLAYSATTNSPTKYYISWSSTPANSFTTITYTNLPMSPITINVPANTVAGTYTGSFKVRNANGCESILYPFSLKVLSKKNLASDTSLKILCSSETVNLNNVYNLPAVTKTFDIATPDAAGTGTYRIILNDNQNCPDTAFINIYQDIAKWTGAVSSVWNVAGNWSNNTIPNDSTHVYVSGKKINNCTIASDVSVASMQVVNDAAITINGTRKLNIKAACDQFPSVAFELAQVSTTSIATIAQTTATVNGNVISQGSSVVNYRGICYSTSAGPTISNNYVLSGNGTGTFATSLTSLSANTKYYVRAFAINADGIAYGEELNFTTLP